MTSAAVVLDILRVNKAKYPGSFLVLEEFIQICLTSLPFPFSPQSAINKALMQLCMLSLCECYKIMTFARNITLLSLCVVTGSRDDHTFSQIEPIFQFRWTSFDKLRMVA